MAYQPAAMTTVKYVDMHNQLEGNPELNPDLARLIRDHVKSSVRDREPLPTLKLNARSRNVEEAAPGSPFSVGRRRV